MRISNVPPGRYAVIWRLENPQYSRHTRMRLFHTVMPLRAATAIGLSDTREVIDRRKGDGWIQKAVGLPHRSEKVEAPHHATTFASAYYGCSTIGRWLYCTFPASLYVHEFSDIYCGIYDTTQGHHHDVGFDWVSFLPLKPDDPAPIQSQAYKRLFEAEIAFIRTTIHLKHEIQQASGSEQEPDDGTHSDQDY